MAKRTTLTITHGNETIQTIKDLLLKPSSKPRQAASMVARFFEAAAIGNRSASYTAVCDTNDDVAASGTITLSSLVATDTITVGTQTFTSSASPSGNNQFLSTGGDTAVAAAAAVKINAHPSLAGVVTAVAALGVITVTSAVKGLIGNQIGIAISAHGSVSGAKLTGGAAPGTVSATSTYHLGV